jgi:hypothetical protein
MESKALLKRISTVGGEIDMHGFTRIAATCTVFLFLTPPAGYWMSTIQLMNR